jgi:hypothetical protein
MGLLDAERLSIGWVAVHEVKVATAAWRTGRLPTGRAFEGVEEDRPDIEETLNSDEWLRAFAGGA